MGVISQRVGLDRVSHLVGLGNGVYPAVKI
jgi:hypothetical protein